MSTTEGEALLQAICAEPMNDAPRLVYADWLEEHGKAPRAEFIRVQLERTRFDERDARFDDLLRRERELLDRHASAWEKEILRGCKGFALRNSWGEAVYRRGFPARVYARGIAPLLVASPLFERLPIEEVFLWWHYDDDLKPAALKRLFAETETIRLTGLKTEGRGFALDSLERLLGSPLAPRIEQIDTHDCDYYGTGIAERLAAASGLTGLRWLDLSGNRIEDEGMRLLTRAEHLTSLRTLLLGIDEGDATNDLTAAAMTALARSATLTRLECLDVNHNEIGSKGVTALFRSTNAASLVELNLAGCQIDDRGVAALARSPSAGGLRRLNLSHNVLSDRTARALANSPHLGNLVRLDLAETDNPDKEVFLSAQGKSLLRERFGRAVRGLQDEE